MKKKKKRIILIILLVIIASLIGGLIYFYSKYSSWKKKCEHLNKYADCGIFNCSVIGYFKDHDLCFKQR